MIFVTVVISVALLGGRVCPCASVSPEDDRSSKVIFQKKLSPTTRFEVHVRADSVEEVANGPASPLAPPDKALRPIDDEHRSRPEVIIRPLRAATQPTTAASTSANEMMGWFEVEYRLIEHNHPKAVMSTIAVHRMQGDRSRLRILDACVEGDRFFVLERWGFWTPVVAGEFNRETGAGRMRTFIKAIEESEALGPIVVDGQIVRCSGNEVRVRLNTAGPGDEVIERTVKLDLGE